VVTLLWIPTTSWGQLAAGMEPTEAPGYYQFPIRTGSQNYLSGTMGELRSNHFHAGIDIKTQGTEGLEVYAAADGHVSRIKVGTGGYGNALYILHGNGTTSVYAHLQKYSPEIAEFVKKSQYAKKSFEIELFPEKNQFQFKKGDIVGYSGNSGSSGGPHLHFEIRDSQQKPLNPLKYQFPEIRDNIAPEVRKIALRTMDKNSRINHQYGRFEFQVIQKGTDYIIPVPITAYGKIGVEILTHDKLNGANNRNGVPCMELNIDGQQVFQQNISSFAFAESRSILIHTDYQTAQEKGQRFVKMYVDNGNGLPFYKTGNTKGVLNITADSLHQIQVNLWDIYNNSRQVTFDIRGELPQDQIQLGSYRDASRLDHHLLGNNLVIEAPGNHEDPCAYVFSRRMRYQLDAAYRINNTAIFLWDMAQGLPDSLHYGDQTLTFGYKAVMPGASSFNYYGDLIEVKAPARALFDTVYLTYNHKVDSVKNLEKFTVCEDIYPISRNINIVLKPKLDYADRERSGVYALDNRGNPSYIGGEWEGSAISFKTRNWGTYTIMSDTLKPAVKPLILNKDQLVFRIDDKLSGINKYELHLDGKWILMNYDYKKKLIRSEKLDTSQPFNGKLELKVTDNAGNVNLYRTNI
jgi:hypothetical protein